MRSRGREAVTSGSADDTDRRRRRRTRILLATAASLAAVALVAAGWVAATAFRSPAQVAAGAAPPPPSVVTAPVEVGTLQRTVEMQVEFTRERQTEVTLPALADPVITKAVVTAGSAVSAGSLLAEMNGSPVFLLEGEFRYYRDLRAGDRGTDVTQLQTGLSDAGFDVAVDGRLGAQTLNAATRLARDAGYELPSEIVPDETDTAAGAGDETEEGTESGHEAATAPQRRTYIPASLFVVARETPATVVSAPAVGDEGETLGPLVLSYGEVTARGTVLGTTATQLAPEMTAEVAIGDTSLEAVLTRLSAPAEDGSITVALSSPEAFGEDLLGSSGTAVIHIDPPGEGGLIVPAHAVVTRADGTSVVQRRDGEEFHEVRVTVVQSVQGRTLIEPADEDAVAPGDDVRVE